MTEGGPATVYVIDDDDAVRDSLLFLLDVEGFAGQGFAGAQAFLAAGPPPAGGCIVTDLRMPGLGGMDLLRLLPVLGLRLPVIVMTGHGDAASAGDARAAGAFDFIRKPFHNGAILGAVRAALAVARPDPARDARAAATADPIGGLSGGRRDVPDPSDSCSSDQSGGSR